MPERKKPARERRAGTKRFDTWKYGPDPDGRTVDIDVVTITDTQSSFSTSSAPRMVFEANVESLEIREQDPDINALRKKVYALVKEKLTLTWTRWLCVRVNGDGMWHGRREPHPIYQDELDAIGPAALEHHTQDTSVSIKVVHFDFGMMGDKKVHRDYEYSHHGGRARDGWPTERGCTRLPSERDTLEAFVPYTPETADALAKVFGMVGRVRELLSSILAQDRLPQTIERIVSGAPLALPSPTSLPSPEPPDAPEASEALGTTVEHFRLDPDFARELGVDPTEQDDDA